MSPRRGKYILHFTTICTTNRLAAHSANFTPIYTLSHGCVPARWKLRLLRTRLTLAGRGSQWKCFLGVPVLISGSGVFPPLSPGGDIYKACPGRTDTSKIHVVKWKVVRQAPPYPPSALTSALSGGLRDGSDACGAVFTQLPGTHWRGTLEGRCC